jgi:glutaredoxin
MTTKLTLFTSQNCPGCDTVKGFLRDLVPPLDVVIRDVKIDKDARVRLLSMGVMKVPALLVEASGEEELVFIGAEEIINELGKFEAPCA